MILRYKRECILDRLLGRFLADAILGRLNPESVDAWTPIPSHWLRRVETRFDRMIQLASAAAARWGGRATPLLRMTRYVRPLHLPPRLDARQRADLVRGAFAVRGGADVRGRSICLIDDVTTTGATLREARRVLMDAGAARVGVAVVARAGWAASTATG